MTQKSKNACEIIPDGVGLEAKDGAASSYVVASVFKNRVESLL